MKTGIDSATFQFLSELKENNNRDWFNDNKPRYLAAKDDFTEFLSTLHQTFSEIDSLAPFNPKKAVFRIYRDVRFSKNKDPYKTNIGGILYRGEEWTKCPWYVHLEPGNVFVGGGIWEPPSAALKAIRQEIDYNPEPLKKVLNDTNFLKHFGQMNGDQLKKAPQGYDVNHPEIVLLRYKQYLVSKKFTDKQACGNFLKENQTIFETALPFFEYFDVVLKETGLKV